MHWTISCLFQIRAEVNGGCANLETIVIFLQVADKLWCMWKLDYAFLINRRVTWYSCILRLNLDSGCMRWKHVLDRVCLLSTYISRDIPSGVSRYRSVHSIWRSRRTVLNVYIGRCRLNVRWKTKMKAYWLLTLALSSKKTHWVSGGNKLACFRGKPLANHNDRWFYMMRPMSWKDYRKHTIACGVTTLIFRSANHQDVSWLQFPLGT
jgi:hypothetical protein